HRRAPGPAPPPLAPPPPPLPRRPGGKSGGGARPRRPPTTPPPPPPQLERLRQVRPMLAQVLNRGLEYPPPQRRRHWLGLRLPPIEHKGAIQLLWRDTLQNGQCLLIGLVEAVEDSRSRCALGHLCISCQHTPIAWYLGMELDCTKTLRSRFFDNGDVEVVGMGDVADGLLERPFSLARPPVKCRLWDHLDDGNNLPVARC